MRRNSYETVEVTLGKVDYAVRGRYAPSTPARRDEPPQGAQFYIHSVREVASGIQRVFDRDVLDELENLCIQSLEE